MSLGPSEWSLGLDEDNILVVVRQEKRNLHDFIESEKGVLSVETIVALGWDIIGALNSIHSHGLVHRNLHSGNILVDTDDDENYGGYHSAVILDLGFYGSPEKETDILYKRRYVYGVLPFVAPEVLRGNEHTAKSDIYSFEMILWTMLLGEAPWRNEHFNAKLARSIVEGNRPGCPLFTPPFLYEIVKKCWELDPNNRPTSEEINKRFEILESAIHDDFNELEIYGQQVNADNERKRWVTHNTCAQKYKIHALSSLSSTRIPIVEN
ncbi:kinase-like domain-containing protein [Rhizophagus diaphanus]|nr:kinase-like domain-containing protein [Rhizophagus diaphanus] [Rhizophagus sp. MUCL 43196]